MKKMSKEKKIKLWHLLFWIILLIGLILVIGYALQGPTKQWAPGNPHVHPKILQL